MVQDKNYFVITTNADHLFIKSGFEKERLFYTQGDYGLLQCSEPCHKETYDNRELIYEMVEKQRDFKIPSELIPRCPRCGKLMEVNLRKDGTFVEDEGWKRARDRYEKFVTENLTENSTKNILFLELGVGYNTPIIIKYPFWQMTYKHEQARYICLNKDQAACPKEIEARAICMNADIYEVISSLIEK